MTVDLSWLRERRCERVEVDVSGTRFDFGGAMLHVECPWRIVAAGRIVVGSVDHVRRFGRPSDVDAAQEVRKFLDQRRIEHVRLDPESADLTLDFGDGIRLEIWNNSSGYEGWNASGPAGQLVVAMGGGELAVWSGDVRP